MSKSYIQKITPFIDGMRFNAAADTPSYPEGTPFEKGQVYNYIYYNKDLPFDYINSVLESLTYEGEEGEKISILLTTLVTDDFDKDGVEETEEKELLMVGRIKKSIIDSELGDGNLYIILGSDSSAINDGWVYCSETIELGGTTIAQGWYTENEGQINRVDVGPIENVNEWDKVKTIFSSTEF